MSADPSGSWPAELLFLLERHPRATGRAPVRRASRSGCKCTIACGVTPPVFPEFRRAELLRHLNDEENLVMPLLLERGAY